MDGGPCAPDRPSTRFPSAGSPASRRGRSGVSRSCSGAPCRSACRGYVAAHRTCWGATRSDHPPHMAGYRCPDVDQDRTAPTQRADRDDRPTAGRDGGPLRRRGRIGGAAARRGVRATRGRVPGGATGGRGDRMRRHLPAPGGRRRDPAHVRGTGGAWRRHRPCGARGSGGVGCRPRLRHAAARDRRPPARRHPPLRAGRLPPRPLLGAVPDRPQERLLSEAPDRFPTVGRYFSQSPISYALPGVPPITSSVVGDDAASNLREVPGSTATTAPSPAVTVSPFRVTRALPRCTK